MTQTKTLVIIRHAHRNKPKDPDADNGLSAKGRKQAQALAKFYARMFGKTKARIYSSPKTRCIETVAPIAKKIRVATEILDSLNEAPSSTQLNEKVRSFHALWLESETPLTVICTHGDWIPAYLKQMVGVEADLDKGGWIQLDHDMEANDRPCLRWIVQDPSV